MRICVINPFSGTEHFGRRNLERIASADTQFDVVDIGNEYPLNNNQWLYFRHSCTSPTIDRAIKAEREGYDGILISCNLDIGLYECRQMCTIPVMGTLESAALVAHVMGRRFALLSVDEQNGEIQRMLLEQYRLAAGLVGIRSFGIDASDLFVDRTDPKESARRIIELATKCMREDGADVLIAGCTHAGSILSHMSSEDRRKVPVPVIDGMLTGFKMTEMMVALQRCGMPPVGRSGMFQFPPLVDLVRLCDSQNRPMPKWTSTIDER